jgi:hypothetical protein
MKTPSKTSPKGGKRGCLCKDGTYSNKCCDGSLEAQGIGSITGIENVNIVVNEDGTRTTTRISG